MNYQIIKDINADKMFSLYDVFHTFDVEYCVDRLEELVKEQNDKKVDDYEIFKANRTKK